MKKEPVTKERILQILSDLQHNFREWRQVGIKEYVGNSVIAVQLIKTGYLRRNKPKGLRGRSYSYKYAHVEIPTMFDAEIVLNQYTNYFLNYYTPKNKQPHIPVKQIQEPPPPEIKPPVHVPKKKKTTPIVVEQKAGIFIRGWRYLFFNPYKK
jgi:hypothetical protein